MIRRIEISAALLGACIATNAHAQAPVSKEADPAFRMQCQSRSVKSLPRGNAAVGNIKFALHVDPAAQQVIVDITDKRKAAIDKFEVWFKAPDGNVISISRSTKTWRLVVPIEKADDSRKYLYFEGDCQLL